MEHSDSGVSLNLNSPVSDGDTMHKDTSTSTLMDIDIDMEDEENIVDRMTRQDDARFSIIGRAIEVPPCNLSTQNSPTKTQQMPSLQERRSTAFRDRLRGIREVLNLDSLLRACIPRASSMLKDKNPERTTKRIQLLMGLMNTEGRPHEGLTFLDVLKYRVYLLLNEKETSVSAPHIAKGWLSNEAAALNNITHAGTFR